MSRFQPFPTITIYHTLYIHYHMPGRVRLSIFMDISNGQLPNDRDCSVLQTAHTRDTHQGCLQIFGSEANLLHHIIKSPKVEHQLNQHVNIKVALFLTTVSFIFCHVRMTTVISSHRVPHHEVQIPKKKGHLMSYTPFLRVEITFLRNSRHLSLIRIS